jgi:ribosomal protein S18 acetylase RimI-like enzyme
MDIRPFAAGDATALQAFLARIPAGESAFFKEDISSPTTVQQWTENHSGARRYLAVEDGEVVGYTSVTPGLGWSSHVGEIRLVVDPDRRRHGIGHQLARQALVGAVEADLRKVVVEVVADQEAAIGLFTVLGFTPEAVLRDHVRDRNGELRDLMVLAHDVQDVHSAMTTVGIDEELR